MEHKMALSNSEKQRRFRERQRAKRASETKTGDQSFANAVNMTPFFKTFQASGNQSDFELCFDLMGLEPPEFEDDSGPKSINGIVDHQDADVDPYGGAEGSLGRAEVMVGCLLDAATTLAGMIRQHKLGELNARMNDAEGDLVRDPADAPQIADRLAGLVKMRQDLQRDIRWTVPSWKTSSDDG
jgi:hypothetical protein